MAILGTLFELFSIRWKPIFISASVFQQQLLWIFYLRIRVGVTIDSQICSIKLYRFLLLLSTEVSQPSLGAEQDERYDLSSPPASPLLFAEGTSHGATAKNKQTTFSQKPGYPQFRKYHDSSLDADDTESELVAIPESDQSDSTLHGSSAPVYC